MIVRDHKKDRRIAVDVTFKAIELQKLRMDIATPGGHHLGSVAVNGMKFSALMPREKKLYQGTTKGKGLAKLLTVPLSPIWLNHALFDRAIEGWDCQYEKSYLKSCEKSQQGWQIHWSKRVGNRKLIHIKAKQFSAEIAVKSFSPTIRNRDRSFDLALPKGFRIEAIR